MCAYARPAKNRQEIDGDSVEAKRRGGELMRDQKNGVGLNLLAGRAWTRQKIAIPPSPLGAIFLLVGPIPTRQQMTAPRSLLSASTSTSPTECLSMCLFRWTSSSTWYDGVHSERLGDFRMGPCGLKSWCGGFGPRSMAIHSTRNRLRTPGLEVK
jgi:hypothetical protein